MASIDDLYVESDIISDSELSARQRGSLCDGRCRRALIARVLRWKNLVKGRRRKATVAGAAFSKVQSSLLLKVGSTEPFEDGPVATKRVT